MSSKRIQKIKGNNDVKLLIIVESIKNYEIVG